MKPKVRLKECMREAEKRKKNDGGLGDERDRKINKKVTSIRIIFFVNKLLGEGVESENKNYAKVGLFGFFYR